MGKEKDKKPLFGGIFQKFFKPSAKAEAKKKKEHHLTVQRSIPYLEMGRDGICRVEEHLYSKTVRFYDINYQLAQNEDKNTIFESWCDFLNYFDSSIRFQLSFINHKSDMSEYLIKKLLSDGDMRAREIYMRMKDEGISRRTAENTKKELGIRSYRKMRQWYWSIHTGE